VLRYLGAGGPVVFDGRQDWLTKLGFTWLDRQLIVPTSPMALTRRCTWCGPREAHPSNSPPPETARS